MNECRECNNSASASISLGEGPPPNEKLPDLSISPSDITIIPPGAVEGQPAAITAIVHNGGTSGAADVMISFYDGDPQSGGGVIGSVTKSSIDAGATAFSEIAWNTFGQSGRNYIHVIVDPGDVIREVTKSNNSTLIAVDVGRPSKPDLAVTSSDIGFSSWSPQEGEVLAINVVVHNLGADTSDVEASLYDGDPAAGGALLSLATMPVIIPFGGAATVTFDVGTIELAGTHGFYISLDPENKMDEISEANNTAWNAVTVGPSGLGLSLSTDKAVYTANENAQVGMNLENLLNAGRTGTLSLRVLDAGENVVAVVSTGEPVTLDAAESKLLSYTWNTARTLSGSYKASGSFIENGNVIARADAPILISPVKAVSARVATDKVRYAANRQVTVTSTIAGGSPNYIFHGLAARVSIRSSAGDVLFSKERPIQNLVPGALVQLETTWNTASNPKGSYTAELQVLEGGTVLGGSTSSFEVLGSSETGGGLTGALTAYPNPVFIGQDETIAWTVTNNGNEDLSRLTLTVLIVDPDTEEVKNTLSTSLDLAMSASASGSFISSTLNLEPGFYLAVLQVSSTTLAQPKTLGSVALIVEPGIEAAKTIPDATSLLVWVNGNKCEKRSRTAMTCEKECVRVDLLESMLKDASLRYHIVYGGKDFEKELRNPVYTDFLILGDRSPMEDHFADELREQVYSGKGLVSSLYLKHGECGEKDYGPLLGIRYKGRLPGNEHSIDLLDSPVSSAGELEARGDALKVEARSSEGVLAWIENSRGRGSGRIELKEKAPEQCPAPAGRFPAIVANTYGLGSTLFLAFDLGSTLKDGDYGRLSALVKSAIKYIHRPREEGAFHPHALIPVEVSVKSLGGSFDLELAETWPEGIRIFDPATSAWITDNPWVRTVTLEAGEARKMIYYVLAPEHPGTYTLVTDVSSTTTGASRLWQTLIAEITVEKDIPAMLDEISAKLAALAASKKDRRQIDLALDHLDKVSKRAVDCQHDLEENIHDILEALDHLISITTIDTTEARLLLDDLLKAEEGMLYTWPIRMMSSSGQTGDKVSLEAVRNWSREHGPELWLNLWASRVEIKPT